MLLEIKTISPIVSHKLIGRSGDYQIYLPDNDTLVNGMVEGGDGGGDDICFALLLGELGSHHVQHCWRSLQVIMPQPRQRAATKVKFPKPLVAPDDEEAG